jgi:hypothetical protein
MTRDPNQTLQEAEEPDEPRRGAGRAKPLSADLLGPNSEIGRKLKQYYDELVSDDVPDRFADLLSKLEQAESTDMIGATAAKAEG